MKTCQGSIATAE